MDGNSVNSTTCLEEWRVNDVCDKIREKYDEDVSKKFKEQKIDGRALRFLANEGSQAQFQACGLTAVGDQLLLKELVSAEVPSLTPYRRNKKPTVLEVKSMSNMNQRIYKAKRKAVSEAAIAKWPGNKLPIFKKDLEAKKELEELVEEITDECSYEPAGFDKESIRQHILDVINERRRRHRNGHDYTQLDKRKLKKKSMEAQDLNRSGEANCDESQNEVSADKLEVSKLEKQKLKKKSLEERDDSRDEVSGDELEELVQENKRLEKQKLKRKSLEEQRDDSQDEGSGDELEELIQENKRRKEEVPVMAAKIIIQEAFNAVRFQDVAKKQIIAYVKKYHLTDVKTTVTLEKEKAAQLLSMHLIKEKIICVRNKDLSALQRADVSKVKTF